MTILLFEPISTWEPGFVEAIRRHYTGSRGAPPGRKLAWRIHEGGRLIGWIGVGEPPYKLAARRRLGIADARPLPGTVCDFIYRLEYPHKTPCSLILRAWHPIARDAWAQRYGEQIVHWESLVQPDAVRSDVAGLCYRRAGYRSLGMTTGRSARRPAGHTHSPRVWMDAEPKLVLYKGPLVRVDTRDM